ncbi:MAG: ABC transporter ATP-binding protein [Magnetococcales bacterium]|nr:ABC transporter ATP-binding protein [Magnetococcales bacterium]
MLFSHAEVPSPLSAPASSLAPLPGQSPWPRLLVDFFHPVPALPGRRGDLQRQAFDHPLRRELLLSPGHQLSGNHLRRGIHHRNRLQRSGNPQESPPGRQLGDLSPQSPRLCHHRSARHPPGPGATRRWPSARHRRSRPRRAGAPHLRLSAVGAVRLEPHPRRRGRGHRGRRHPGLLRRTGGSVAATLHGDLGQHAGAVSADHLRRHLQSRHPAAADPVVPLRLDEPRRLRARRVPARPQSGLRQGGSGHGSVGSGHHVPPSAAQRHDSGDHLSAVPGLRGDPRLDQPGLPGPGRAPHHPEPGRTAPPGQRQHRSLVAVAFRLRHPGGDAAVAQLHRRGAARRHGSPQGMNAPIPLKPLLSVENLWVRFQGEMGTVDAVQGISFFIAPGETVALVGESGSGKSVAALSLLRLLPPSAIVTAEGIYYRGRQTTTLDPEPLRKLRGAEMAMVFQEPMTALNPVYPIGRQLIEALQQDPSVDPRSLRHRAAELLDWTGIPDPESRLDSFPHQLSGGQRQRVLIAMALARHPSLLIADEPTTALDVTIQAQILELLTRLRRELNMAMLLITHDLPMVRKCADRVYVMRQGRIVETAPTQTLFSNPRHPYTRTLLAALPDAHPPRRPANAPVLLTANNLRCHFPIKRGLFKRTVGWIKAVDEVSFQLRKGETLGVVGESGSGKTTLGEAILQLNSSQGEIRFADLDLRSGDRNTQRLRRRRMQVVFQDPFSSLSPRLTIGEILEEGLLIHGLAPDPAQRRARVQEILAEVGLDTDTLDRYPHQFSGGQRQRIAIARAMILKPELLVLDEPTSALDLSVQAQILKLLKKLQQDHGLAYLFISHDLRVIRAMAHEVMVMQNGRVVEAGPTRELFDSPRHPYTQRLLAAALDLSTGGRESDPP